MLYIKHEIPKLIKDNYLPGRVLEKITPTLTQALCIMHKIKLSNRRAIGEHTSTAVNCIPPAEVALNLAVGDFERNGDIYGHWGGMGVSSEENESK